MEEAGLLIIFKNLLLFCFDSFFSVDLGKGATVMSVDQLSGSADSKYIIN